MGRVHLMPAPPDHIKVNLSKGKWHFVCTRCGGNMLVESAPRLMLERLISLFAGSHQDCAERGGER